MKVLVSCAALACAAIGWFGFAVAGWSGLLWTACGVLAFLAFAARVGLDDALPTAASDEGVRRGVVGHYPQYEQLATQVRRALSDGRYFVRVLAPDLRRLAHEVAAHRRGRGVTDEQLALAVGTQVWALLTADPHSRDRDDVPSDAELAMILTALEGL